MRKHPETVTMSYDDFNELCKFVDHVAQAVQQNRKIKPMWLACNVRRVWRLQDNLLKDTCKTC